MAVKNVIVYFVFASFFSFTINTSIVLGQTTVVYTTSGSWTCPNGIYQIQVECWGAGGGGATMTVNGGGGGGGGGAYSTSILSVTPGSVYSIAVGTGGTPGVNGGSSSFNSPASVLAVGGNGVANNITIGGTGGLTTACIGTTKFNGGNGANGSGTTYGGGGGGGAGSTGVGSNSTNATGGNGAPNNGGKGGNGRSGTQGNGSAGSIYGGGGGGALRTSSSTRTGGSGANGYVVITYYIPATPGTITSDSPQCPGTGVTFSMGSCASGCTCYWVSSALGTETTDSSPTTTSSSTPGTYTVWVRARDNTSGNWSAAVSASGTVGNPTTVASSNSPVCEGQTLLLYSSPDAMFSYAWSGPDGYSSTSQDPIVSASATVLMAGTYTVTVTATGGCTGTASVVVTINTIPACAGSPTPADASSGIPVSQVLSWSAVSGATSYDVYLGTTNPPTASVNVSGTSYTQQLYINTTYYWYVVPKNNCGSATGCNGTIWSFTTSNSCGGDAYRTIATGNWTNIAIWEVSASGGAWGAAAAYPTSANACSAEICNGHTVTVSANITAPNTVIDASGTLTNSGFILTYGSGYTITNYGTLSCSTGGSTITAWDGKGIFIDGASLINYGTVTITATGVISLSNTTANSSITNLGLIDNYGGGYYWDGISGTTNYFGGINANTTRASTVTNYNIINNNGVNLTAAGNYRAMLWLYHYYNYKNFNNIFKRANTEIDGAFTNTVSGSVSNTGNIGLIGTGPAANYGTYYDNWCTTVDNGVVFTNAAGATITLDIDGCLRFLANKGTSGAQCINNGTITNGNKWSPSNVDGLITATSAGRVTSYTNNATIIDNGPINNGGSFTNTTTGLFYYKRTTGSISGNSLKYRGNALLSYNGSIPQTTSNYEFPMSTADSPSYIEINNSSGVSNGVTLHASRTVNYNSTNPPTNGVPYLTLTNGALRLNGFTLTINSNSASAISRDGITQLGYIVSEQLAATNNSIVAWLTGTTTGDFIYPFGATDGTYIPVTFNKITSAASDISISTRTTATSDNTPWATSVSDMNCIEGVNSSISTVVDRWWNIAPSASVTANVTFSYRGSENTTTGTNPNLALQRWDATGSYWNDGKGGGSATYNSTGTTVITSGVGTATAYGLTQFTNLILLLEGSTLPVQLVYFNASCVDGKPKIVWTTASETNNDFFTIERSADAIQWDPIFFIDGAGNSNSYINYSAFDNNPLPGYPYYRLKQVDFDGAFSYSNPIQIECSNDEDINNFSVKQDPENSMLSTSFTIQESATYDISLFDYSGRLVKNVNGYTSSGYTEVQIPITGLVEGIYLVTMQSAGKCFGQKVLIR